MRQVTTLLSLLSALAALGGGCAEGAGRIPTGSDELGLGAAGGRGGGDSLCGNGVLDASEACDGTQLDGEDCETLGMGPGTLACSETCRFDLSMCQSSPTPPSSSAGSGG